MLSVTLQVFVLEKNTLYKKLTKDFSLTPLLVFLSPFQEPCSDWLLCGRQEVL